MERTHFEKLITMYDAAPINGWFKPRLRIPGEGQAEIEMAVREEFFHAAHSIHGAIYFKVLDDATFFAAQSLVTDAFVVTSTFQLYFYAPSRKAICWRAAASSAAQSACTLQREFCLMTAGRKSLAVAARLCPAA
jgi:acyl-coenzyme A thioesterase PaaI-like protein